MPSELKGKEPVKNVPVLFLISDVNLYTFLLWLASRYKLSGYIKGYLVRASVVGCR